MKLPPALNTYHVGDLLISPAKTRLAFLMESPHTAEVSHKHPLAGRSGKSVSRFLVRFAAAFQDWDPAEPFGCQLIRLRYPHVGIINCANFPLAPTAYAESDLQAFSDLIAAGDVIRRNPGTQARKDAFVGRIERHLLKDLARRIGLLPKNCLIVPCGAVARKLLSKCDNCRQAVYPLAVPHPSRNNWWRPEYFDDRDHFISVIQERVSG